MKAVDAAALAAGVASCTTLLLLGRYWGAGAVGLVIGVQLYTLWRRKR